MKKTMTMMKVAAALTSIAMSACMFTAVSARQYRNNDDEDYRIVDAYIKKTDSKGYEYWIVKVDKDPTSKEDFENYLIKVKRSAKDDDFSYWIVKGDGKHLDSDDLEDWLEQDDDDDDDRYDDDRYDDDDDDFDDDDGYYDD